VTTLTTNPKLRKLSTHKALGELPQGLCEDLLKLAAIVKDKKKVHLVCRFEEGQLISVHISKMKRLYTSNRVG